MSTLAAMSTNELDGIVSSVLNEASTDRRRFTSDFLRSGFPFDLSKLNSNQGILMDQDYRAVAFTDHISSSAWKTGEDAKRALCISADYADAVSKRHDKDLIVITHLALQVATSSATLDEAIRGADKALQLKLEAPDVDRATVFENEAFASWLVPDLDIEGVVFDADGNSIGRQYFVPKRVGVWERGLRRLPRPIVIPNGKAATLSIVDPNTVAPGGNYSLPIRTMFRYHKIRGVSGS